MLGFFRIFILLFIYNASVLAQNNKLVYDLQKDPTQNHCVKITAQFFPNNNQEVEFVLPPLLFKNINIFNIDKTITPETITQNNNLFKITNVDKALVVQYDLCYDASYKINYPVISKDFTQLIVFNSLAYPNLPLDTEWDIDIYLQGWEKEDQIFTCQGSSLPPLSFHTNLRDFLTCMMQMGGEKVHTYYQNKIPIFMTIQGTSPSIKHDFITNMQKIIDIQTAYWNDFIKDPLLISIVFNKEKEYAQGHYYYNNIILEVSDTLMFDALHAFSHEFAHTWLGRKIKFPFLNTQWFYEGFSDYLGSYFLLKNQFYTKDYYIKRLNFMLHYYTTSNIHTLSNDDLAKIDSNHINGYVIAAVRGHILAMNLENMIKNKHVSNPVDLILRDLLQLSKRSAFVVKNEDLQLIFNKHTKLNLQEILLKSQHGNLQLPHNIFEGFAKLHWIEMEYSNLGFDVNELLLKGIITNLDPKSPAYAAGLRETTTVDRNNFDLNEKKVRITIKEENGKLRDIVFIPAKATKIVPQYIKT